MIEDGYVFCDLETTGLVAQDEVVLEIGFALYNRKLEHVESKSWLCLTTEVKYFLVNEFDDEDHAFVREMHTRNGLLDDLQKGFDTLARVHDERIVYRKKMLKQITGLLEEWGVDRSTPMCGSSLRLDRAFLEYHYPTIDEMFSYRIIDASSFMEFLRVQNPEQLEADMAKAEEVRSGSHRVLTDIHGSVNTLRVLSGMEPVPYDHR